MAPTAAVQSPSAPLAFEPKDIPQVQSTKFDAKKHLAFSPPSSFDISTLIAAQERLMINVLMSWTYVSRRDNFVFFHIVQPLAETRRALEWRTTLRKLSSEVVDAWIVGTLGIIFQRSMMDFEPAVQMLA